MLLEKWKMNKKQLIILLCIGILLVVIAIPTQEQTQIMKQSSDLESRLEMILSQIEGSGDVQVMITTDEEEKVQGIAVSAQGGDKPVIVKEITDVVQALFDIETHKIKVIKGK